MGLVYEVPLTWYLEAGKRQLIGVKLGAAQDKEHTLTSLLEKKLLFRSDI